MDRVRELSASVRGLRIVIERPCVPRAVVAKRRWPIFAGNERSNECACRLILPGDQAHGQSRTRLLRIKVHPQRGDRTPAASRLLGVEEAKEHTATGRCLRNGKAARGAELVIQRL